MDTHILCHEINGTFQSSGVKANICKTMRVKDLIKAEKVTLSLLH